MYLTVHSHPAPAYSSDPKKVLVKISCGKERRIFLALRREGGQRVILPEEIYPFILNGLKENKDVLFQMPGYESALDGKNFMPLFEKFQETHPYDLIIHLPL